MTEKYYIYLFQFPVFDHLLNGLLPLLPYCVVFQIHLQNEKDLLSMCLNFLYGQISFLLKLL